MYEDQKQGPLALAYIAGILDGEGSFMITKSSTGKGRKSPQFTPRIKVQMVDPEAIEIIVAHLSIGTVNLEEAGETRGNRRPCYLWQVHSLASCHYVSELMLPYLRVKRDQCALMLQYCINFNVTKSPTLGVPLADRTWREQSYDEMRRLNARGSAAETKPWSLREEEAIVRS